MNKALLLNSANQIEMNPAKFDISTWRNNVPLNNSAKSLIDTFNKDPYWYNCTNCYTTVCIAGWVVLLKPDQICLGNETIEACAMRILFNDDKRWNWVFHLSKWPSEWREKYNSETTVHNHAKVAIDLLRTIAHNPSIFSDHCQYQLQFTRNDCN